MYARNGRYSEERRVDGMTREEVCHRYRRRILLLARRLADRIPPGTEFTVEDLVSFGAVGLLEAFDRYDPTRNIQFSTFAEYRIRGAMMDALRRSDEMTRYRRDLARRIEDAERALTAERGRAPEPEEVAGRLGMDLDAYWQAMDTVAPISHASLDEPGDDGRPLAETIEGSDGQDPYRAILGSEIRERLREAIQALPERKKQCVLLYYGRGLNLAEIAEVFGVTPSRISQILSAARRDLRRALERDFDAGDVGEAA